ncbi:hypothetical protein BDV96DRAFT_601448 [Lophiotrema nucula]|uniref:SRPBCC domain-containing protein n=1 Tax=Lophiotrema nucula TaxID=690887 RepID=A0A6A5Z1D3_9PLEO|nr:hypothetical protein BDV96DRAFT_601448 [Lophiotrema nucula]
MPTIRTEIEIAASPETVRSVFLNWPSYPSWNNNFRLTPPKGKEAKDLQKKEYIKVEIVDAMKFSPYITKNDADGFSWMGFGYYIFNGEHQFSWTKSEKTPGGTTLVQKEDFSGLLSFLVAPGWSQGKKTAANFSAFNEAVKKEAERLGGS